MKSILTLTLTFSAATVLLFSTGCTTDESTTTSSTSMSSQTTQEMAHTKPDAGKHKRRGTGGM